MLPRKRWSGALKRNLNQGRLTMSPMKGHSGIHVVGFFLREGPQPKDPMRCLSHQVMRLLITVPKYLT
jgi:hypothetical protein